MSGSVPISDLEKMLELKTSERDKYVKMQNDLRHGVTDADYTAEELADKEYRNNVLPSKIIGKMQPLLEKEFKLNTEIKLLEEMLGYKK